MARRSAFLATAAIFLAASQCARADSVSYSSSAPETSSPSGAAMVADLILVRPLGVVATALGGAIFLLDMPLMPFQDGGIDAPYQRLLAEPAHFTFKRPLGASN